MATAAAEPEIIKAPAIDDLRIEIAASSTASEPFDRPFGRSIFPVLSAGPDSGVLELKFYAGTASPSQTYVLEPTAELHRAARYFSEARQHLTQSSAQSLQDAAESYGRAAALSIDVHHLSAYARLAQATILYDLFLLDQAAQVLEQYAPSACVPAPICHQLPWLKAKILFAQDKYEQSIEMFELALKQLEVPSQLSKAQRLDRAEIVANLGFAQILVGQAEAGKARLDEARKEADTFDAPSVLGHIHNYLGGYHAGLREYDAAEQNLKYAAALFRDLKDARNLVYTLGNLSHVYIELGEYVSAKQAAHEAVDHAEQHYNPSLKATSYSKLGQIYLRLGDYNKAQHYAQLAVDVDTKSGRIWRSHVSQLWLGKALRQSGRAQEASALHEESVAYFQSTIFPDGELQDASTSWLIAALHELSLDQLALGKLSKAKSINNQAWELLEDENKKGRTGSGRVPLSTLTAGRGQILMANQEYAEAERLLREAYKDFNARTPVVVEVLGVSRLLVRLYRRQGKLDKAMEIADQAISLIEQVRDELEFYRLGPAWTAQTFDIFLEQAGLLLERSRLTGTEVAARQALVVLERGRATNLLHQRMFSQSQKADGDSNPSGKALLRKLRTLAHRRALHDLEPAETALLTQQYYRTLEQSEKNRPWKREPTLSTLADIESVQERLRFGEVVIDYICVPANSVVAYAGYAPDDADCYAFIISADSFAVNRLGDASELKRLAIAAADELDSRRSLDQPNSEVLADILLSNILPGNTQKLYFSATSPFDALPIAALPIPIEDTERSPLLAHIAVTRIPSVSTLLADITAPTQNAPQDRPTLTIFANPNYSMQTLADALSSLPSGKIKESLGERLFPLPWSEKEAGTLARLFPGEQVLVYTGEAANRNNLFASTTRRSRILHIASHGFFDAQIPELVGIIMTATDQDDGFITLPELFAHTFQAELVVVSGCETALGQHLSGEGMMSLARGFHAQGADHVISTLWPVADRASADFMKLFYHAYQTRGLSAADALRAAQNELRSSMRYKAPYYWAPYVLSSVGRPR